MEPPSHRSNSASPWGILWRHYRLIAGLTLACAACTALFSLFQKKVYRASTYLLLSGSKIETGQTMIPNYVYYELLRSYEVFLLNDELIQATIEHFGLQSPPNSLTVDDFRKRRIIEIESPKNTRLLEVRAEFPDPRLAAEIVNFFASAAVRFNDELYARDLEKVRSGLNEQLDRSAQQLESVAQRLKQFDQSSKKDDVSRQLLDEYQAARDVYDSLNWKYQDAASSVGSRSSDLKIIARALPPTKPYKPWIALNSILGGALGFLVSIPLTLSLHYFERSAEAGTKSTGQH